MAHVQPGDIVFFKAAGIISRLNVLGQSILTRRRSQWSHVATCVQGPLVVHATPRHKDWPSLKGTWPALTGAPAAGAASNPGANQGGVHLELLEHEYLSGATFTVMRPWPAAAEQGFADRVQEASTYFLAQQYSFLRLYLSNLRGGAAVAPGQSFCSFLAQQICARVGLDRFGVLEGASTKTLMPGELFDLLSSDPVHWQIIQPASLHGDENEETLTDVIRRTSTAPIPQLTNLLAKYKGTMATMMVVARARVAQIEYVQLVNQVFRRMNRIREQIASARAQLPASDVNALVNRVQKEIGPLLERVLPEVGDDNPSNGALLFMNYRSLLSIVLVPKGSLNIDLKDHWKATLGGATLTGPDEDLVDRYIASQSAIVATIALRQTGALPQALDARWDLPADLRATLALIQDDIRSIDACRLPDWQVQRPKVRELLVSMQDIVRSALAP